MSHQNPTLIFSAEAWRKALTYVKLHKMEINGWAYVEELGPRTFYVRSADDVFITDQLVTGASADVDGATYAFALDRARSEGRMDKLRLQWHSHVRGDVYYSSVDIGTIESYAQGGVSYMISVVLNMYDQVEARIDAYTPVRTSMPMDVRVEQPQIDQEMIDKCTDDMLQHVQVSRPVQLEERLILIGGELSEEDFPVKFSPPEPLDEDDLSTDEIRIQPVQQKGGSSASRYSNGRLF